MLGDTCRSLDLENKNSTYRLEVAYVTGEQREATALGNAKFIEHKLPKIEHTQ